VRATPSDIDIAASAVVDDPASQRVPALDDADLEVPSFLRRGGQTGRS
jgi:hypothetical protein